MGSVENPLVHCHTIRDFLNRINRIYNELIDHENTLPKCETCWENHTEFNSLKGQLFLIVQDNATGKEEEHPAFEYVQLEGGTQIQPFSSMVLKEEPEFSLANNQSYMSDIESDGQREGNTEHLDLLEETDDILGDIKPKKEKMTCIYCFKDFSNEGSLKEHMAHHARSGPFNCCTCGTTFESLDDFTIHRQSHSLGLGSSSMSEIKVESNAKSEMNKSQFDCAFCGMEFSKKRQIISHIRVHMKPENPNDSQEKEPLKDRTCNICRRSFNTFTGLKKHLAIHEKKKECPKSMEKSLYSCKFCHKSYRNSITLDRHMEFRNTANINCDTCNEKFCIHTDLQNHQKTVHRMNISLKCQYCKEQFLNYRLIYRHHRKIHPQEPVPQSPYLCEWCGLSMMDSSDLSRHVIWKHNSSKRPKCDVCQKIFAKEEELEEHRRIHIPISQLQDLYTCDLCPRKFRMKRTLVQHKRLHTTNKITETFCEVCGKRFINIEKLQAHQLKHAEEGPRAFKCDLCGHHFKELKLLNQHRKISHNIYTQKMLNTKPRKK